MEQVVAGLRIVEPRAVFTLSFPEQYRNMRYWLEKDMRPVEFAREAVRRAGLTPISTAIRGGTDGSNLTARGLPCPRMGQPAGHGEIGRDAAPPRRSLARARLSPERVIGSRHAYCAGDS